jgi:hypothetical protein
MPKQNQIHTDIDAYIRLRAIRFKQSPTIGNAERQATGCKNENLAQSRLSGSNGPSMANAADHKKDRRQRASIAIDQSPNAAPT